MGLLDKTRGHVMHWRLSRLAAKLPGGSRRKFTAGVYGEIWKSVKESMPASDDSVACAAVMFECPYSGHVSYYVGRVLGAESSDSASPISRYEIAGGDGAPWVVSLVSTGPDADSASIAADACLMAAVLSVPTVPDEEDYRRILMSTDGGGDAEGAAASLMELVPAVMCGQLPGSPG